jgi:type I restriction enzyme S subunit
MNNTMKKYDNYKDSGIEWIGDVPNHWELKKIKHLGKILSGYSFKSDDFIDKEGCRVMKISNIQTMKLDWKDESFLPHSFYEKYSNFQVKKGDLVFALTRPIISSGIKASIIDIEDEILLNQRNAVLKPNEFLNVNWIYYLVFNPLFINHFESLIDNTGQQPNISSTDISNISIFLPPLLEQTAIANYLDHKTSQIDHLIAKKVQFIKLLEEERVAVINQAVTKGLDPNVPMKDSGVEWLGEIPEHWEVTVLKYILKTTKGFAFKSELFTDNGLPIVKASDIKNKSVRLETTHYINEDISNEFTSVKLSTGDILISTVGSSTDVINSAVGQIGKVPKELDGALLNQNTVRLEVLNNNKIKKDYLFFIIQNDHYRSHLNLHAHGTANQASLKLVDLLSYKVALPSLIEQNEIIDYVENNIFRIQTIIDKSNQEIELLKEYKTALISEVVTGKVDVSTSSTQV